MLRIVLFGLLLSTFTNILFAQPGRKNSVNVSTGVEIAIPTSGLARLYRTGTGATLKGEYVFANHASLTLATTYLQLRANELPSLNLLPLLGGLRYYTGNFYVGAETGTAFAFDGSTRPAFVYAFSAGDEIITKRNGNSLDISLRLQRWNLAISDFTYGIRVAYEFRLR